MNTRHLCVKSIIVGLLLGLWAAMPAGGELVLVQEGTALAPTVIFKDAPPFTRQAADELAEYIEKTSGARPDVLEGEPDPLPDSAIWIEKIRPVVLSEKHPIAINVSYARPGNPRLAQYQQETLDAGRAPWR